MRDRLLLVHSPLVGCGTWEPVAQDLAAEGYAVSVPDLASAVAAGPPYHLRQAQLITDCAAGQPVILIGHSRGGPLLPAAGTMLTGKHDLWRAGGSEPWPCGGEGVRAEGGRVRRRPRRV